MIKINYPIRINKYLREKGLASRREADKMIADGKVLVNGRQAKIGAMIGEKDKVTVGGAASKNYIYLAYNKPRGLATQAPENTESVISQWRGRGLFPIGRLDKESEGLLILTNDGRLTTRLTSSQSPVEKEYIVNTREDIKANTVAILERGMRTETFGQLLPAKAEIVGRHSLSIILREGKRHQIRVMLAELGYTVESLKRVRIGKILLGKLRPGETRALTVKDF